MAWVLLALFFSMKMMGLHELTHNDEETHPEYCYVCDFAKVNDTTPVLLAPVQGVEIMDRLVHSEIQMAVEYTSVFRSAIIPSSLFGRPPPVA